MEEGREEGGGGEGDKGFGLCPPGRPGVGVRRGEPKAQRHIVESESNGGRATEWKDKTHSKGTRLQILANIGRTSVRARKSLNENLSKERRELRERERSAVVDGAEQIGGRVDTHSNEPAGIFVAKI